MGDPRSEELARRVAQAPLGSQIFLLCQCSHKSKPPSCKGKKNECHAHHFLSSLSLRPWPKRGTSKSMRNHPPAKKKYWEKKSATTGGKKNSPRYSGGGRNPAAPPALAHGSSPKRTPAAGILPQAPASRR